MPIITSAENFEEIQVKLRTILLQRQTFRTG
jgi:hypothetical protein